MTPLEIDVLDFTRSLVADAGISPTLGLIAGHCRCSEGEARHAVDSVIAQGFLTRRDAPRRPLALAGVADVRSTPTDAMIDELRRRGVDVRTAGPIATRGSRTCAVDHCGEVVRVGMLMCRRHWFLLPAATRNGLKRTSQTGEVAAFERLLTRARHLIDSGEWRTAR